MKVSYDNVAEADSATQDLTTIVSEDRICAEGTGLHSILRVLGQSFAEPFAVVDVESGDLIYSDHDYLGGYLYDRVGVLAEVSRRGSPEIVEEVAPLTMLALPLGHLGVGASLVAVGVFVNQQVANEEEAKAAARAFGIDAGLALRWSQGRIVWQTNVLQRMAETVHQNLTQRQRLARLEDELAEVSAHTDDIYAELELLHRLTGQLHLSESEAELWRNALGWLADTISAQCLVMVLCGNGEDGPDHEHVDQWDVLTEGECPVENEEIIELIRRFCATALRRPILLNRAETTLPTWHCPTIRELVCVPIDGGELPRGWLLALNHRGHANKTFCDFGSVEIQLLRSVGTILGIHNSNLGLYREQSRLFSSSVQALISAIDAKDRYTAGHSNRVARYSVSLAQKLGLSKDECDTIFLAGLLHDIGKIGIDDQVLNKPGRLTKAEFEHIKLHPRLGYEILKGIRPLEKVLPIVLHHHEAWNGSGYPEGLVETATPRMARIMAVADAFDAMSSDRPYRQGMSEEESAAILREGAGSQWDPEVIEAFFEIRDEIRQIAAETTDETSAEFHDAIN